MIPRIEYIEGEILGECAYIKDVPPRVKPSGKLTRKALFACKCGKLFEATLASVKAGKTVSCGCRRSEAAIENKTGFKHGKSCDKIYTIWAGMKQRCYNSNSPIYNYYGGRGIKMSEEWYMSFENFYADMIESYREGLSIDRIEVNGDYCKENCRWATMKIQSRNRRNNYYIIYNGQKMCKKDYCDTIGINYDLLDCRLRRGWALEEASNPIKQIHERVKRN